MKQSDAMRNQASSPAERGAFSPAEPPRPWYREPWPWLLMSGPAAVVVAGFITLWLAIRSDDGLVVDDYYKQGLAIQQVLERDLTAVRLDLKARVSLDAASGAVRLRLSSAGPALPDRLLLHVVHPTRGGRDQAVQLHATSSAGDFGGKLALVEPGRWLLNLEDPGRTWRIVGEWTLPEQGAAQLLPSPPGS